MSKWIRVSMTDAVTETHNNENCIYKIAILSLVLHSANSCRVKLLAIFQL